VVCHDQHLLVGWDGRSFLGKPLRLGRTKVTGMAGVKKKHLDTGHDPFLVGWRAELLQPELGDSAG
jgi:hypothetical protein